MEKERYTNWGVKVSTKQEAEEHIKSMTDVSIGQDLYFIKLVRFVRDRHYDDFKDFLLSNSNGE